MEVATGALGTLIPKLGQLLQDEYNLQKGVKKDIEFLSRELDSMHAALRSVGEVPREELKEQVRIWARDVRELSYDMEDIVDTFLVRVRGPVAPSKRSAKRFMKKMMNIVTKAATRHEIGQEIKDIKERVKEVAERRDRYKVDAIKPEKILVDPRITALYTKATDLVGIDEAREELIMRLTNGDDMSGQQQRVVSIVGFGGLGKTTLAKVVYDQLRVQFDCTAFVSVSQNPDLNKLLKNMLYELDKEKYANIHSTMLEEKHLIDLVREFLQNKRYFIVIDDIWDMKPWGILRCSLHENGLKSIIITTTRILDVAEQIGGCYRMKPLTHESSKKLFYGRIFGSEDKCPGQYFEVSEKILKKCGGVPLAIITTSSLLANKSENIKVWNDVCGSIGSGLASNPSMDSMRKILLLSYYDLPSHLKACLLYLSIFPEDYEIEKYRLILRWIAEDFVHRENESQSLFEHGESYFNELLNRSLIQIADRDTISFCRVHDMVLELICSLSREESFVTTVLGDSRQCMPSSGSTVRRLSLQNTTWPKTEMPKLRSVAIFSPAIINTMPSLSIYHLLRVLDLQDCNLRERRNLRFVGNLFHLRYLSLARAGYAGELPVEVGKLQFLQSLLLHGTEIEELPSSIVGLTQLMFLCVDRRTSLPNGLKYLTSLEMLGIVRVDSACIAEELGHLMQLRLLLVNLTTDKEGRWDENICTALVGSLGKLHKIQTLIVLSDDVAANLEGSVESVGNLSTLSIDRTTSLPTWIRPAILLLLSYVDITVVQVRREDIQVLGRLQALRYLYLGVGNKQVLERFMVRPDAFPCAITCIFSKLAMVPSTFPPGAMPRLEKFIFGIQLEDFLRGEFTTDDLALGHLPSLQDVQVYLSGRWKVSEEVVTKVKEKLRHEADGHPNHPSLRYDDDF
ncbi:disease resistance protein RGA5-like [Panicum virgatum]|uniref:disease resistance protein RGA5-like n=1 Tax=Panicum virgatum TaxID=38727 RepID=UPI0019D5BB1F|nr:disease resistance protein RGA5-like [Panicum virgatum]XP_039778022.1 disease resistance protein RGA5-like [Panicum virgatum]